MSADNADIGQDELEIRLARDKDAPILQQLARDAYQQYVVAEGSEPEPMKTDYLAAIAKSDTWVAEYHGTIVGFLVVEAHSNFLLLDNIAVIDSVRGRGVGRRLMDWSESRAIAHGLLEIRLYTGEVMTQNRHYYERRGFAETHRAFEKGHHRVYYSKPMLP